MCLLTEKDRVSGAISLRRTDFTSRLTVFAWIPAGAYSAVSTRFMVRVVGLSSSWQKTVRAPITVLTQQNIEPNMRAVDRAIAQQELEGLKVPEATVADLCRAGRGEIETEEVIRNVQRRFQHGPVFG